MEKIIDYLAEEEAQEQKQQDKGARVLDTEWRTAGKKERIAELLKNVANVKPEPMNLDFLTNAFGD